MTNTKTALEVLASLRPLIHNDAYEYLRQALEQQRVPEARLKTAALAISNIRAAEYGGCFRPDFMAQDGECADGACYCSRQCEREAQAALSAATNPDNGD